jgi:hypothetical protein
MIFGYRLVLTPIFALLWLLTAPALASGVPDDGVLDFAILRNNEEIGRHTLRFETRGQDLNVRIIASIDFRFGFIPLYQFDHQALETWRGGGLLGMSATTRDNGDDFEIEVQRDGDGLTLTLNGETTPLDGDIVPASLWNIALVTRDQILDPADGEIMAVVTRDAGAQTIRIRGREIVAQHYIMTGDFERDLWYDRQGVLMQVRFKGDDGSDILYQLR